jgi:general secretion pathway protein D
MLAEQAGRIPSQDALDQVPAVIQEKVDAGTLTQDGKLFYELGRLDEAESRLKQALAIDPRNRGARFYLDLVREARQNEAAFGRENYSRDSQLKIERAWDLPVTAWEEGVSRVNLPIPNPYSRTNMNYTGMGRQIIMNKLDRIRLDTVIYDGLPLGEVVRLLNDEAKKRDPEKRGINFLLNPNQQGGGGFFAPQATQFDPVTGLPIAAPPPSLEEETDLSGVLIKINPPLTDMRMADVLQAIITVSEQPIKYSIEEYAVVFSFRAPEPQTLYTREFKVDPNTFWSGLESVGSLPFGDIDVGSQSSGGGGRGGGSSRGGQGGQGDETLSVPRVNVAGQSSGGRSGGGGQAQQQGGAGLRFITKTNTMEEVQAAVRQFFITMGVDLTPPKTIFFNDRSGALFARATSEELDIIQSAIQVLNRPPPQVNIKAKFADIGQQDVKAIGFDWLLGNFMIGNNVVGSGGTSPSLNGQPSGANPLGFFPGTSINNITAPSASDQNITSGLRNPLNAPALASITGILTDPQFKVVIRALEQRAGVDLLSAPEVTTLSGRQAQVQVIDLQSTVTGIDLNQTGTGGGGSGINNQGGSGPSWT